MVSGGFKMEVIVCALGRTGVAFLLRGKVRISFHPDKPSGTTSKLSQRLTAFRQSRDITTLKYNNPSGAAEAFLISKVWQMSYQMIKIEKNMLTVEWL